MTDNEAPEDLGAPVAYLVLKNGTAVYDRSGDRVGEVERVLADEQSDVFQGLLVKTGQHGQRFARADQVDGLFEHGVIVAEPADQLPEPGSDLPARVVEEAHRPSGIKRAWDWLIRPR
jgi:sporulation protein YlmC with PRC-barrel domain